jgi:hypothetical protein
MVKDLGHRAGAIRHSPIPIGCRYAHSLYLLPFPYPSSARTRIVEGDFSSSASVVVRSMVVPDVTASSTGRNSR